MTIPFQAFDPNGKVEVYYHGSLPHWRQDGCTYFVTFRLADSLPVDVKRELQWERDLLLRRIGIDPGESGWRKRFSAQDRAVRSEFGRAYGLAFDGRLDQGLGRCILRKDKVAMLVKDGFRHWSAQGAEVGDLVVMPNHVHVLVSPPEGRSLEELLCSIKGYTSRRIRKLVEGDEPVWQRQSHDRIVRDARHLRACQRYIRENPRKAGLGEEAALVVEAEYCVEA